ncbi:acetate--CoA ligase family protein [Actinomadura sp. LOL_016]|uniref:acetate--CoA ligase family protein n=1 Tax=Actinomadura sp. LOL_016 TaxID=3345411 RepID=UPI003A89ADCB
MSDRPDRGLLRSLFQPRTVAVIGASNDPAKLSGRPVDYLKRFGFRGTIVPVNPRRAEVQGLRAFPDIASYREQPVDLAIIALPAPSVAAELRACARAGVPLAIVFASGFAEAAGDGPRMQRELREICDETGIRLLGPNCLGGIATGDGVVPTFTSALDGDVRLTPGPVAIVSQSGAFGTYLFSAAQAAGMGIGYFANTGNEVDVTAPELMCELLERDDVGVVLGYLEGISDPAALVRAGRTAARVRKPLVLVKVGATEEGARAAAAHTGARPVADDLVDDVLERLGVIRAGGLEEMIDIARLLAAGRRPVGDRLTVLTMSGGAGVLLTDGAIAAGMSVPAWSAPWRDAVAEVIPPYGSARNPLDITGSFLKSPEILERALDVALDHPDTDIIAVLLGNADRESERVVETLTAAYARTSKPMPVVWTGGSGRPRELLGRAGVPVYTDPARAVRALAALTRHALRPAPGTDAPGRQADLVARLSSHEKDYLQLRVEG